MERLDHLHLSPQGFLFDHNSGVSYTTNGVGAFVLGRLIAGDGLEAVRASLLDQYETTAERVDRDLEEFVDLLRRHRLLPKEKGEI